MNWRTVTVEERSSCRQCQMKTIDSAACVDFSIDKMSPLLTQAMFETRLRKQLFRPETSTSHIHQSSPPKNNSIWSDHRLEIQMLELTHCDDYADTNCHWDENWGVSLCADRHKVPFSREWMAHLNRAVPHRRQFKLVLCQDMVSTVCPCWPLEHTWVSEKRSQPRLPRDMPIGRCSTNAGTWGEEMGTRATLGGGGAVSVLLNGEARTRSVGCEAKCGHGYTWVELIVTPFLSWGWVPHVHTRKGWEQRLRSRHTYFFCNLKTTVGLLCNALYPFLNAAGLG